MQLTRQLATHIVSADYKDLSEAQREATKRSILDTLGVMLAATSLERVNITLGELMAEFGGRPDSTLLTGGKAPCWIAAFVNGALAHALDYDDGIENPPHHPTASTLPAALAIAEWVGGISGPDFITAVALANDLSIRMASGVTGKLVEDYPWFPITTFGVFSATAAAGRLLGLDVERMINALGIAQGRVSGILEAIAAPESEIRTMRDGYSNKEGVLAALMASRGISACKNPIEILYRVLYRDELDQDRVISGLGRHFRGADVHLKAWPSCRETHGHIHAALDIVRAHAPDPADIAEVVLTVGQFGKERLCEPVDAKRRPTLSIGAKFSLPFTVAVALAKGRVEINHFLPENLNDPGVIAMTERVRYQVDTSFGIVTPAIVEVILRDGTRLSSHVAHVYGDLEIPLSREDLIRKFRDCAHYAKPALRDASVDLLIKQCLGLEDVRDMRELTASLAPAG